MKLQEAKIQLFIEIATMDHMLDQLEDGNITHHGIDKAMERIFQMFYENFYFRYEYFKYLLWMVIAVNERWGRIARERNLPFEHHWFED